MKVLIKNIRGLVGAREVSPEWVAGAEMAHLPVLEDAWLAAEDGLIADFGPMSEWPGISDWRGLEVVDAEGRYILPGWCDSHTHIVFAGSRAGEFTDRIRGLTYEEIAAKGGGILNSARLLRNTPEDELLENALHRLNAIVKTGTVAVEIKSGYGLTTESELKMLRVIRRLKEMHSLTIKSTLLAAHAVPEHHKANPDAYVKEIIEELLPRVAEEQLADFIDVFCETNYFTVAQMERILEAGAKCGLPAKVHVNQFNAIGAVAAAVKHQALSVDHLEVLTDEDLDALKGSRTMPVGLPGCSLFIRIPYTPARRIIDAGLPLALATDFNPGSAPSGNMNLVNSLACIHMSMLPQEVIQASTLNGAYAMGLSHSHGSITPGKEASFILTKKMQALDEIPYYFGENPVDEVWIKGRRC
ncbi:MAG: imidazolonepropionase [Flavobacteriales bacterium]